MKYLSNYFFRITWILFLSVILTSQACGVFETRKAAPPQSGDGSTFIQPDQSDIVISNLENAIKSLNTQNYLRCFSDSVFAFTPTVAAQQANPGIWDNWSKFQEQTYFNNLQSAAQNLTGHQLQLSNQHIELQSSTVEQFTADYTLTVVHNRTGSGIPTVATGRLVFIIKADSFGLWHITKWTDITESGSFTWSDLKAAFIRG